MLKNLSGLALLLVTMRYHGVLLISVLPCSQMQARPGENGQPGMICGLLSGDMNRGSIFHVLSWRSNLSKRPVKPIDSAEKLAADAALD